MIVSRETQCPPIHQDSLNNPIVTAIKDQRSRYFRFLVRLKAGVSRCRSDFSSSLVEEDGPHTFAFIHRLVSVVVI